MKTESTFVDFSTKDEAESALIQVMKNNELIMNAHSSFCPLHKGPCSSACVCYNPARVHEFKYAHHSTFRLYGHFCGNAMFSGYRWNQ